MSDIFDLEAYLARCDTEVKMGETNFNLKCPYHDDAVPSFSISRTFPHPFICFGCGVRGNIFTLVRRLGGSVPSLEYSEAKLKRRKGCTSKTSKSAELDADLHDLWDNAEVVKYVTRKGLGQELAEKLGIKYTRLGVFNGGSRKFTFRDRLIVPLWCHGKIQSFEARDFTCQQKPKVLYPPGTRCDFLYNYDNLDRALPLIVTEGVTHTFPLAGLGYNVTATFGSHLRMKQMEQMLEFPEIILFQDFDEAGVSMARTLFEFFKINRRPYSVVRGDKEGQDVNDLSVERLQEILRSRCGTIEERGGKSDKVIFREWA